MAERSRSRSGGLLSNRWLCVDFLRVEIVSYCQKSNRNLYTLPDGRVDPHRLAGVAAFVGSTRSLLVIILLCAVFANALEAWKAACGSNPSIASRIASEGLSNQMHAGPQTYC